MRTEIPQVITTLHHHLADVSVSVSVSVCLSTGGHHQIYLFVLAMIFHAILTITASVYLYVMGAKETRPYIKAFKYAMPC
jgi:hypothetical protein